MYLIYKPDNNTLFYLAKLQNNLSVEPSIIVLFLLFSMTKFTFKYCIPFSCLDISSWKDCWLLIPYYQMHNFVLVILLHSISYYGWSLVFIAWESCRWSPSTCFYWHRIPRKNRGVWLPSCLAWSYEVSSIKYIILDLSFLLCISSSAK